MIFYKGKSKQVGINSKTTFGNLIMALPIKDKKKKEFEIIYNSTRCLKQNLVLEYNWQEDLPKVKVSEIEESWD
jgi:hypothetical protein